MMNNQYQLKVNDSFVENFQEKYCLNKELDNKLEDFDILYRSSIHLNRPVTPLSRDSGIPIRSTSTSSCCSTSFERTNTLDSSFISQIEEERALKIFLHPSISNPSYINPSHEGIITPIVDTDNNMPFCQVYEHIPYYNNERLISPKENNPLYEEIPSTNGKHITLNASLPFYSKLNIRIQTNRSSENNSDNQVKATAKIRRLTQEDDYQYLQSLKQSYVQHYLNSPPNYEIYSMKQNNLSKQYNKLPEHRQVYLPTTLPFDSKLVLYMRNGEIFARC